MYALTIARSDRQDQWAELDGNYWKAITDLWATHTAELNARESQMLCERRLYRNKLKITRKHYKKKIRRLSRAHRVELDQERSDSRALVKTLEAGAHKTRKRLYKSALDSERFRYGWIVAEACIGNLRQALDARKGGDSPLMDVDEIPSRQLPDDAPSPSHPYVQIPSGSLSDQYVQYACSNRPRYITKISSQRPTLD